MSQSLPLFRAFQQNGAACWRAPYGEVAIPSFIQGISTRNRDRRKILWEESQSLPLFRAFQHWEVIAMRDRRKICRNPFLYSGHFNPRREKGRYGGNVRRNPFLYSGHFNNPSGFPIYFVFLSQSLPLFRAFQQEDEDRGVLGLSGQSQSLPLFRAFQHYARENQKKSTHGACRNPFLYSGHFNLAVLRAREGGSWGVAIPSFIQGISTKSFMGGVYHGGQSRNPFLYSGHFNI